MPAVDGELQNWHAGFVPVFVNQSLVIPDSELQWRFTSSGGPGGQHANKAATQVEVIWEIAESAVLSDWQRERLIRRLGTTARASADDHRSQYRNRNEAIDRLGVQLRTALAPPPRKRRPTRPTKGSQQRRLKRKRERKQIKKLRRPPDIDD